VQLYVAGEAACFNDGDVSVTRCLFQRRPSSQRNDELCLFTGGDVVAVEDVQRVTYDRRTGELTSAFRPTITIPGLGTYKAAFLELHFSEFINERGTPSLKVGHDTPLRLSVSVGLRIPK
jgi:hypothetical protein